MKDFIKRMALAGIGFASLGRDKIEDIARDISQNLDLSEEEGRKVAEEILEESRKAREDVEGNTRETANKLLEKMDIPSKKDLSNIENRVKKLEKELSDLKKEMG